MKNIQTNKTLFQSFVCSLISLYRLFFGLLPEPDPKPFIFVPAAPDDTSWMKAAATAFELKKSGGAA